MKKFTIWLLMAVVLMSFSVAAGADDAVLEPGEPEGACETPGDANDDGRTNIVDVSHIINGMFWEWYNNPAQADANGDGVVNIDDAFYLLDYIFEGGPEPVCPE